MRPVAPQRLRRCALALALLALAGCGEDRGRGTATSPRSLSQVGGREIAVSLTEYRLSPSSPRVTRGGTIAFDVINDGAVEHALAVEGLSGELRTPALAVGGRARLSVRLPPGTYKWYCPLRNHERLGMTGRIRVGQR